MSGMGWYSGTGRVRAAARDDSGCVAGAAGVSDLDSVVAGVEVVGGASAGDDDICDCCGGGALCSDAAPFNDRGSMSAAAFFFSARARAASCAYSADETAVASLR